MFEALIIGVLFLALLAFAMMCPIHPARSDKNAFDMVYDAFRALPPSQAKTAAYDMATDLLDPEDQRDLANMIAQEADRQERDTE